MRRAVELHWPAFLVGAVCAGLGLSIWVSIPLGAASVLVLCAVGGVLRLGGEARLAAVGVALAILGLAWGSLRMDALRVSVLADELGETGTAELVTVAPARSSLWSTRVIAVTRAFRYAPVHERVLLVLPVGRSPPRGAILEATVRIAEPQPEKDGFDERAWLARQGVRVVLEASSWRELGRRGGISGFGDRLRDRIERAVSRGTDGVRRGIVLGVVLGEDEGLPSDVQDDFRASGLYHLLRYSSFSRTHRDPRTRPCWPTLECTAGLITRRSQVQILPPLPGKPRKRGFSVLSRVIAKAKFAQSLALRTDFATSSGRKALFRHLTLPKLAGRWHDSSSSFWVLAPRATALAS